MTSQGKKQGVDDTAADATTDSPAGRPGFAQLDAYDITILSVLSEQPRLPLVEMAKSVHLSRSAISRRLVNLKERGLILDHADIVSYSKLGFGVNAEIEIATSSRSAQMIRDELLTMPEVLSVSIVSGDKQIVLNVVAVDMEHFRSFVEGLQRFGDTATRLKFSTSPSKMSLRDRIQALRQKIQL